MAMFGTFDFSELLLLAIVGVVPFWFIFSKAGFSGWWCLLMLMPIVNLVMLYSLALREWPLQQELGRLKRAQPQTRETPS